MQSSRGSANSRNTCAIKCWRAICCPPILILLLIPLAIVVSDRDAVSCVHVVCLCQLSLVYRVVVPMHLLRRGQGAF